MYLLTDFCKKISFGKRKRISDDASVNINKHQHDRFGSIQLPPKKLASAWCTTTCILVIKRENINSETSDKFTFFAIAKIHIFKTSLKILYSYLCVPPEIETMGFLTRVNNVCFFAECSDEAKKSQLTEGETKLTWLLGIDHGGLYNIFLNADKYIFLYPHCTFLT